jgi:ATP-dependent Lhr-like helicase
MDERFKKKKPKKEIMELIQELLYVKGKTAESIYNYFNEQHRFLGIPHKNLMIIEKYKHEKNYLIFHNVYGRRVNDALSRAIGFIMGKSGGRDVEVGINDNGFYIAGEKLEIEKVLKTLNPENLEDILKEAIEKTDVLARRFRHCASRALMILRNYKGTSKTVGKQQMKSHFLYHAVRKLTGEFPILREARREVLEDLMDIGNAKKVLRWIKEGRIKIEIKETPIPSPFATNLILQGYSDLIRIEDRQDFLKRIHKEHLRLIGEK